MANRNNRYGGYGSGYGGGYGYGNGRDRDDGSMGDDRADEIAGNLVSKDGDVLGGLFKLPKPLRIIYQVFAPDIKAKVAKVSGDAVSKGVEVAAVAMRMPDAKAKQIGKIAGLGTSYIIPYIDTIGDLNKTRKVHHENRKIILKEIAPLLEAKKAAHKKAGEATGGITDIFKSGYDGNHMVETAMKAVSAITYHNLANDATKAIPNVLVNYKTKVEGQLEAAEAKLDAAGTSLRTTEAEGAAAEAAHVLSEKGRTKLEAEVDKHTTTLKNLDNWGLKASGAAQLGAEEFTDGTDLQAKLKELSFGKVMEIGAYLHDNQLDGSTKQKDRDGSDHVDKVTELVETAFKQFQKEERHRPIASHRLHDVSRQVAEQLVTGDMNYLSLYDIIGKGELLNEKHDGFVGKEKIRDVLQKEMKVISKTATINVDDDMANRDYTLDDIKSHLASKDPNERALVIFAHPKAVVLAAGMKEKEYNEALTHVSNKIVADSLMEFFITPESKFTDEQLKAKHYEEDDIYKLRGYADDPKSLLHDLNGPDHGDALKELFRKGDMMGQQSDYWKNKVRAESADKEKSDVSVDKEGNLIEKSGMSVDKEGKLKSSRDEEGESKDKELMHSEKTRRKDYTEQSVDEERTR